MNHDDYMTPKGRTNNFLSHETAYNNPIHVFTNPSVLSPPISALKGEFQKRGIPVEVYSNPEELLGLINRLKQKAFIVIETPRMSATDVSWVFAQKFAFPKTSENIKIVTFPGKISQANYEQAKQKNDVLSLYDKHFGVPKQSSKIKLRKVHSSKDIKYELASPQAIKPNKAGKQVFFQKLLYSDFRVQPDSEFKLLTESINNTPNTSACLNFNELKASADAMQGKGNKLLFLVSQKALKDWREFVEKSKLEEKVEFMVLGDLKPSKELLKSNVYFASDNGEEILNELQKLKFQQVQRCRSEFIHLTTCQKNQFKFSQQSIKIQPYTSKPTTPQKALAQSQPHPARLPTKDRPQLHRMSQQFSASIFSNASSQFQRYMRNWTVDIDPKAIDRRTADWVIVEQEGKQHIEGPSEPMSKRASRITARRNSSESSEYEQYSSTANNLMDEYHRLKLTLHMSNSTVNISVPNDLEFNKMHSSHQQITSPLKQSSTPLIQQKSPSKKIIQIIKKPSDKHQTKHLQLPSNVIMETSEEYRGSNRQSIVNLDDHFYHYTQGSGNNLGGSAGNMQSGNFSKVKNGLLGPAEQPGMRKTVHQDQSYPAQNRIINLGYDNNFSNNKQQLPIDSPPISQLRMKQRVIDGLTGELLGNYNNNNKYGLADDVVENKKVYETITVAPYQADSSKNMSAAGSVYQSKTNINDVRTLAYDKNRQRGSNKNNTSTTPIATTLSPETSGQTFIIDGLTGQLLGQSYKRMQSLGTVSAYSPSNNSNQIQSPSAKSPQILRPSHYIQPQIVKIASSSGTIRQGSRESIATEKKLNNNNSNNYNTISNNYIQSATSITQTYGNYNSNNLPNNNTHLQVINSPRNPTTTTTNANQNTNTTNYIPKTVSNERGNSPTINYSTTPISTSNYQYSNNYKVYTPEEYAAKYQNGTTNQVRTISGNNNNNNNNNVNTYNTISYTTTTTNPQSSTNTYTTNNYTTRQYTQNYNTTPISNNSTNNYYTTTKQPQVINRVYIKASDLPQSTGNQYNNKRYETSPNHYVHDYKAKLTVEDTDPFNEITPSKHSSMRKGSYLMRKEDGKRDPYSPYQENTSQLLSNQKSNVKVYTSEEYQKVVENRKFTSPSKDSNAIDLNNYDRVIQNGVAVYKPKTTNYTTTSTTKVQSTKQVQPSRDNYHQSKVTVVNGYKSGVTRYEPSGRDYANSPTRRQGSSYEKALRTENPLRRPSNETYQTRTVTQNIKNVIPLKQQRVTPLVYDSRSPMKVTQYRTQSQKNTNTYTYTSPNKHIYQRRQMMEPRVQASNFNDRVQVTDKKRGQLVRQNLKGQQKDSKTTKVQQNKPITLENQHPLPQNQIGIISGIHKNSQIFQLSDGSIMRRNNIKFGINKYTAGKPSKQEQDFQYLGQLKSRIQSKIINLSEVNRNVVIEKKLTTEQQVLTEKEAYSYINTSVNEFCFLLDDELGHVGTWITKYLKGKNDRVEQFRGMQELYEKIQSEKTNPQFDVVFVFVRNEDLLKVNKKVLPENCFVVEIVGQEFKGLEVSQKLHHIRLTKLPYLKLAQKIIIQTMLTHIILYQRSVNTNTINKNTTTTHPNNNNYFHKQVTHLLSLFPQGQFIKQPYDSPLSFQLISTLVDDPKYNRLYIICNQKQMTNVVQQLAKVSQQTLVPQEICKIICIPQDNEILRHEQKIQEYPRVAWMTNSSKIQDYKSLIKYALRQEEDDNMYANKQDTEEKEKIFYHTRHRNLNTLIEKEFPQRFQFQAFNSLGEVEKKVMKSKAQKSKDVLSPKKPLQQKTKPVPTTINYLILHPILSEEYIDTKLFKKIFMLGKSDKTQRKVVKVGSNEELMELLKR